MKTDRLTEEQLCKLIEKYNNDYWSTGVSEISDIKFDQLMRALAAINPHHPLLDRVSVLQVTSAKKVTHMKPMLSLDKIYTVDEMWKWMESKQRNEREIFIVQPKYDGASAEYFKHVLSTRGDGYVGSDISDKLPLIKFDAKSNFTTESLFPVEGEIVISDPDFQTIYLNKIKNTSGEFYKNSRNAVAGVLNTRDITELIRQHAVLTFVQYGKHEFCGTITELKAQWGMIVNTFTNLPYPQDGLVIKLNDGTYRESLGATAHHPRGQIALKSVNPYTETIITSVEYSPGKSALTPVANLVPVNLSGITVKRASLQNIQNIIDNDIRVGDIVTLERAGDVTPYISNVRPGVNRASTIATISHCPFCQTPVTKIGPNICCTNTQCVEVKIARLYSATRTLKINYLGKSNIRKLVTLLNVSCLSDILNLSFGSIISLEGYSTVSANKLLNEIEKAKKMPDYLLLAALNIPSIGINVAKLIMQRLTFAELRSCSIETLTTLPKIDKLRAQVLFSELQQQKLLIDELLYCVQLIQTKQ